MTLTHFQQCDRSKPLNIHYECTHYEEIHTSHTRDRWSDIVDIYGLPPPGHSACGRDGRSSAFDTSESPRDSRHGLIEAKRENIPLGTVVAGVVTEVYVKRGDIVKKDSPCSASSPARIQSESILAFSRFFILCLSRPRFRCT